MTDVTNILYDPFAPAVQTDPYPIYAVLRREMPVHYVESLDAYAVSRHADVRRVMHDHHTFSSEAMAGWSEQMVLAVFEPTTAEQRQEIAQSGEQMGEYFDEVVAARTGTRGDDLVSVLLRAELEGGALTRQELTVFVFTLLVAGSITTAYLIGNALMALATCPALLMAVRDEPPLVGAIVEETLRHQAPVQLMFRTAMADVDLAGTLIPKGTTVLPLLGSANRERIFSDPDRFDIRRNSTEHLAFGHGVHHCLGAALARLEARVAVEELLARTAFLEPDGAMERVTSLVFRAPTELSLRLA